MSEKWVLVRAKLPVTEFLHGAYAVVLEDDLASHENLWELVMWGADGSASEWVRLVNIRDQLRLAHEVMTA